MRNHLAVFLFSMPMLANAGLPEQTGIPGLDARLPELTARFAQLDSNRQHLAQRPTTASTWNCNVPPMTLLAPLGHTDKQHDPIAWANFARANYVNADITMTDIVPLSGNCQNGHLEGPVSFWYQIDLRTDSEHYKGTSRSYGLASMTLAAGQPATGIRNDVLSLTISSNSKYVKASENPDDGMLNVSWKNIDDAGRHVADLESLNIGRIMAMPNAPSSTVWTVRQTRSPDSMESVIYMERSANPVRLTDRYDSNGGLVERHFGNMRQYLAADGSWKNEMVGTASSLLAASAPTKSARLAEKAGTTAPANASSGVTPIEGNTGRYLSPITSDGVAAAWVEKSISASLGSSIGGMAGAYAGQKALEQVPFIGGFLGQKAGAAAGRTIALKAAGGEAYMRETSDLSFNDVNEMARWLVQNHSGHAKFAEIMKAAGQIYPELTQAYTVALRQR